VQSIEKDCKYTKNAKKTCKNLQNRLYYKSKIKKNEILSSKKFKKHQINKENQMKPYHQMTLDERKALYASLLIEYNEYKEKNLSLDLSRGKPNAEQLDSVLPLLCASTSREECLSEKGLDCRNYGVIDGIPEMKRLFSEMLGIKSEYIFVGGNSSLQLMYDTLMRAMVFGVLGSPRPWSREEKIKWICVAPGYDRHFNMTEVLGFELLTVKMTPEGPDMDEVERLVKDPTVKGIWCVPKYSNPTGNTYSDETVTRLAKMECAAPDFRIMWDNAYAVHDLAECGDSLLNIFDVAAKYGNEDRIFYFSSTSKITFPGAGVAMMAASPANLSAMKKYISAQTIGYDKLNQLRHVKYLKDAESVRLHMQNLAGFIGKKFDITLRNLSELSGLDIAEWTNPKGGYFISLDVMPGTAKRVYELMKDAGVTLTNVGATFPHGVDPEDKNLRIAPTYPSDEDVDLASKILVITTKLAALEKLING